MAGADGLGASRHERNGWEIPGGVAVHRQPSRPKWRRVGRPVTRVEGTLSKILSAMLFQVTALDKQGKLDGALRPRPTAGSTGCPVERREGCGGGRSTPRSTRSARRTRLRGSATRALPERCFQRPVRRDAGGAVGLRPAGEAFVRDRSSRIGPWLRVRGARPTATVSVERASLEPPVRRAHRRTDGR